MKVLYYFFVFILIVYFVIDITVYTKMVTDHEFAEQWAKYSFYKFIVALVLFLIYVLFKKIKL
jgi:hypothetical protein